MVHFDTFLWPINSVKSLNCIKQNRLKDDLRGFSMEALCTHEYDKPSARLDHGEGPHDFTFLISACVLEL